MKRRELEARRVPPLRFESEGGGLHTYRLHRPITGRDVVGPLPTEAPRAVESAQSNWARAARATPQPMRPPVPRARPVVSPVAPLAQTAPAPAPAPTAPPPAVMAAPTAMATPTPVMATPTPAHDSTDVIARTWSPVGLRPHTSARRLAWGWWVALAGAALFFAASAALWAF